MYSEPSHAGLASLVAAQGRGNDSMLVHMTPDEVNNLRELARSMGTEMPINPNTGYPEAGWLDGFLNILTNGARAVGNAVINNPQLTGAVIGGTYGLLKGDLSKGLQMGIKAYAGSSLLSGIASGYRSASGTQPIKNVPGKRDPWADYEDMYTPSPKETSQPIQPIKPTVQPNIFQQLGTGIAGILNPRMAQPQQPQQPQQGGVVPQGGQGRQLDPITQLILSYGLNKLESKYGGASQGRAPSQPIKYQNIAFTRGRVNPRFPEPGQPYWIEGGYTDYGTTDKFPGYTSTGNEQAQTPNQPPEQPQNPGIYGMAEGGIVPQQGPAYPMSNIQNSAYSTSRQRPYQTELFSGYDTAVNPFTGEEAKSQVNFADGGEVKKEDEVQNYFNNLRPFAPALSDYYRNGALNTGIGSLQGVPVNTADGLQPYSPRLADWYKSLLQPPGPPRDRIDLSEYFNNSGFRGKTGYNPLDLGKFSTPCPTGQTRNASTGQCESTPPPDTSCPTGELKVNGVCVCPPGQTRNASTNKCETTGSGCPAGQTFDSATGKCTGGDCPAGQTRDASGNCVGSGCPAGQTLDPATGKCTGGECPAGQTRDTSGNCVSGPTPCPAGQTRDASGNCVSGPQTCPDGSKPDANGKCSNEVKLCPDGSKPDAKGNCPDGFKLCPDGSLPDPILGCEKIKVCPEGQTVPVDQPCCKKDIEKYDPETGKCVDIGPEDFKTCPDGSKVPKTADCNSAPPDVKCKVGFVYDPARAALGLEACVPIGTCIGGKVKGSNNECVCPDGSKEDAEGNCVKIGGSDCTGGKEKDSKGNCVCPEGSKEDADGNCKPSNGGDCTGGKEKDSKGNCVCPEGSKEDADGNCKPGGGGGDNKCDPDETQSGDMCYGRCDDGTTYTRSVGGRRPCQNIDSGCAPGKVRDELGNCVNPPFRPLDPDTGVCPEGYERDEALAALGFQVCKKLKDDDTKTKDVECSKGFQKSPSGKGCIPEGKIVEKKDGVCPEGTRQIAPYGEGDADYCLDLGDLSSDNNGGGGLPVGSTTSDGGIVLPGGWTKSCPIVGADGSITGYKTVDISQKCSSMTAEDVKITAATGGTIMAKRKKKKYADGGIASLDSGAINPADGYNFGFAQGGMTDSARERIDLTEYLNTPAAAKYNDPYARMEVKSSQTTPAQTQPAKSSVPAAGSFYPGSGGRTYWEPSWNQGQGAWVDIPKTQQEWLAWDQQTGGGEFEGGRSPMNFANPFRSNPNGTMSPVGSAYNPNAYANWIDDPEMQQRTWFDFMPNLTPERKAQVLASARAGMGTPMAASANKGFAAGGMASMPEYKAGGKLLRGPGDGMSDDIPAVIKGEQPQRAALADGEFVIPADVVSHLGNGSTEAGAKKLYKMMEQIRQARTGKAKQAPRVNTDKFLPSV